MGILWSVKKAGYRTYHAVAGAAVKAIKFPDQNIITGEGTLAQAADLFAEQGCTSVFVACSRSVHKHGLLDAVLEGLDGKGIRHIIYEDIHPNPSTDDVEMGFALYKQNRCDAILAVGGGSPLDCAKAIGLRAVCPKLGYREMKNMLRINRRLPFMVAVPSTAGTGSESTVAAVISNHDNHEKYAIVSPNLMPHCVILDPVLLAGLPAGLTASTGMDALTHAIEAFIGTMNYSDADREALDAIKMIFESLEFSVDNPGDLAAREKMLVASNKAGYAFTREYVGYVHSFSHALSAMYDVPHGRTNAILLPVILDYYGESIYAKMAEISRYVGFAAEFSEGEATDENLTKDLIARIRALNVKFGIPDYVEELKNRDVRTIVHKSLAEANPGYPVPRIMNYDEGCAIMKAVKKQKA